MELQPLDGWRMLIMPSNYVTYTYRLVDDGILGITYGDSGAGSGKVPHVGEYGDRIALKPGKLQRLYFLWEISSITAHVGYFTATLKIYYRPRRLTLN